MVTYVLDSSAILCFTDNEPGVERVQQILDQYVDGAAELAASAIHWGEVAGRLYRSRGRDVMEKTLQRLAGLGIQILPVTAEQAVSAALLKAEHKLPYIDAFGAVLASAPHYVFVTADFDLKLAPRRARIEYLPAK